MKSLKVIDLVLCIWSLGFGNFTAQISLRDKENKEKYIGMKTGRKRECYYQRCSRQRTNTVIEYGEAAFMVQSWISW
jgi:threonyl-tRNA synthetase